MPVLPLAEIAPHLPARGALIGLDLGTKTIGVAASDPDRRLATGVTTVARKAFTADAEQLLALAAERKAAGFVLGLPINMDGSEGPRAQSTRAFARNFARLTALPIGLWDERLSTALRGSRRPKRDNFSSKSPPALGYWWSMIFSESRCTPRIECGAGFFGIMLRELT